jgi:twitching motility protein PilT
MQRDTLWLARLVIDQGLASQAQCLKSRDKVGDDADLMTFAQELIDGGVVTDVGRLEQLAELAMTKARGAPPVDNPFELGSESQAPFAGVVEAVTTREALALEFPAVDALDDARLGEALRALLRDCTRQGVSDLHLSTGARPFVRRNRALHFIDPKPLTQPQALRLTTVLLSPTQREVFLKRRDFDLALAPAAGERYRVNLMFHKNGAAGAFRMVPNGARSLADLGFEAHLPTINKMLSYHNGLILVTGPVGAGKTTTLAAMVDTLNREREDHIITVEDPIEVVQPSRGCNVTQREVGTHTQSFFTALKGALREDPDVIVIGELRDLETIEMAISASETGHLVIGTMHTSDAATTLNRLLDVFAPAQQAQIRSSVAESLRGIICQRLLPAVDGGLALACEILVSNTAIQNLIREGKSAGLRNTMETGVKEGMCLMDNVVFGLWQQGRISAETANANIQNRVLRAKIS